VAESSRGKWVLFFSLFRCLFDMQYELLLFAGSDLLLPLSFVTRVSLLGLATTFFGPNKMCFFNCFRYCVSSLRTREHLNLCSSTRSGFFHWHLVCVTLRASYYSKSLTPPAFVWSDIIVHGVHLEQYQLELTLFWFGSYWSHVQLIQASDDGL